MCRLFFDRDCLSILIKLNNTKTYINGMNPKLGENEKASKHEDMAIKDMTSIQNAYQSFAKQNYTMHDNLKLAYGGAQSRK